MPEDVSNGSWVAGSIRLHQALAPITTLVQVLSLPMCTACDTTVEMLRNLNAEYPSVTVERRNIADRPEILERFGLLSFEYDVLDTHAVVIDNSLAGVGHPAESTLRRWLQQAVIGAGAFHEWIGKTDSPED